MKQAFTALLLVVSTFSLPPFSLSAFVPAQANANRPNKKKSIYDINPIVDSIVIGVGAAAIGLPYGFSEKIIKPVCPCDVAAINWIDRTTVTHHNDTAERLSDITVGLAVAVPPIADFIDLGFSTPLVEDLTVYTETLVVSGAATTITKHLAQRPLPRTYNGNAHNYRSFYSGHTATTFSALSAAAATMTWRYQTTIVPWIITGTVGTFAGAMKVLAGNHFLSDVAVGAAAGVGFGTLIPALHKKGARVFATPNSVYLTFRF